MRAVVQRVSGASVESAGAGRAMLGPGLMVLAAVMEGDGAEDREWMSEKLVHLRIFPDADGKMNRSLLDIHGEMLLVSNFTVGGDARSGRRPSFDRAMRPPAAREAFDALVSAVRGLGVPVRTGEFGAHMMVEIRNDGPVTIVLDSRESGTRLSPG